MEKLFLIFLSSTFKDLEKEREDVAKAMRLHGYVPMGMENFTPTGEAQWDIICRAIDKCDYYVLIVGGRYGSLNKAGISYTEAEYNYAKKKGLPVLAFIHDRPEDIPVKNTDEHSKQLDTFRKKLEDEYYVGHWNNSAELPTLVIAALAQTINIKPAIGWVRADKTDSAETLGKLAKALAENASLKAENGKLNAELGKGDSLISDIAGLEEYVPKNLLPVISQYSHVKQRLPNRDITWKELLTAIAFSEDMLKTYTTEEHIQEEYGFSKTALKIIRNQLETLKLIHTQYVIGAMMASNHWTLSQKGMDIVQQQLIIRTQKPQPQAEKQ